MEQFIRKMKVEDLPDIMVIENDLFSSPWTKEMYQQELENHDAYVLCNKDEKIIGFMCGWKISDEFSITNFGINKKYQRQKLGAYLFGEVLTLKRDSGINAFFLEVRESNFPAVNFYQQFGFSKLAVRKKYYKDPEEDAICMGLFFKEYYRAE